MAGLAKLKFNPEETERLAGELGTIVAYVRKLEELDTEGIEPTSHVLDLSNSLREDVIGETLSREEALGNAPNRKGNYFCVPRVIK